MGNLPNNLKLDFNPKSISKLESNAKVIQNVTEITTNSLWPNKNSEFIFTNLVKVSEVL